MMYVGLRKSRDSKIPNKQNSAITKSRIPFLKIHTILNKKYIATNLLIVTTPEPSIIPKPSFDGLTLFLKKICGLHTPL